MTLKRRKLIAGNWKMHETRETAQKLVREIGANPVDGVDMLVCPPFVYLDCVQPLAETLMLGAQDCSVHMQGAFTGEVSAPMLYDIGCSFVIVGHSERRQNHAEDSAKVAAKAQMVLANGMKPIICVGETLKEREDGLTQEVIASQLKGSVPEGATGANIVIAYEPVWAIGTGLVASLEQIAEVHAQIRAELEAVLPEGGQLRILYGGSVKPENAGEILHLEGVDGALVGGASLAANSFLAIARAGV